MVDFEPFRTGSGPVVADAHRLSRDRDGGVSATPSTRDAVDDPHNQVQGQLQHAESRTPLDELLVPIKVLAVVAVVGRLELDLVVVLLGGLVRLALAGEALDDALGFGGLRRVGVGVDEVDDLRAAHGVC